MRSSSVHNVDSRTLTTTGPKCGGHATGLAHGRIWANLAAPIITTARSESLPTGNMARATGNPVTNRQAFIAAADLIVRLDARATDLATTH